MNQSNSYPAGTQGIAILAEKYHEILNEVEARDVAFRRVLGKIDGGNLIPWGLASGSDPYADRVRDIYRDLESGNLGQTDAILAITLLMEIHYGSLYPVAVA